MELRKTKAKLLLFTALALFTFGEINTSFAKGRYSYDDVTVDDVKFMGVSASEFRFLTGNDNHVSMNDVDLFGGDEEYIKLLKFDEAGSDSYSGNDYSFFVDGTSWSDGDKKGSWGINLQDLGIEDDKGLSAEIDLVVVLKAANAFTAYRFENLELTAGAGLLEWQVRHRKKNIPALSHLTIYARGYEFTGSSNENPGNGGNPPSEVPEPASLLLFGLGLVGLVGAFRRKVSC